jgi:hypothetical protein
MQLVFFVVYVWQYAELALVRATVFVGLSAHFPRLHLFYHIQKDLPLLFGDCIGGDLWVQDLVRGLVSLGQFRRQEV